MEVPHLNLSEPVRSVGDMAEVAVTVLLTYVAYKVALLVDSLGHRLKEYRSC